MSIYLKDPESGKIILAKNAKKPKMAHHRGRTWDWLNSGIDLGGEECEVYLDTTWGQYAYFERDDKWYKVDVTHAEETFPLFVSDDARREYPSNHKVFRRRERLEKVSKSAYDAFKESIKKE